MMQHTQTHRNNSYNIISPKGQHHTRSTRAQVKKGESCEQKQQSFVSRKPLHIQTNHSLSSGLISPVSPQSRSSSVSSSPQQISPRESPKTKKREYSYSSCSSSDEEEAQPSSRRRLSIADLCNPISTSSIYLTKDEFEALEGFDKFRHSPTVFFDSLKDLASQNV